MEEKERYEIHIYDDVCVDLYNNGVLDKSINDTYKLEKLLNQQDKQIKELEEENQQLIKALNGEVFINYKLPMENAQLKQQLAAKEKEIADLQLQLQQANEIINNPDTLIFQQQQLIDNLKSRLAEKDVEIKKLNACVDFYKSYFVSFQEKVIDELERVKEKILPEISSYVKKEFVVKEFDDQINELKGEK